MFSYEYQLHFCIVCFLSNLNMFNIFNKMCSIQFWNTFYKKNMSNVPHFKIVLIGDSGVGKSSIIQRYVFDQFSLNTQNTSQNSFFQKIENIDNQNVILELWDVVSDIKYQELNSIVLLNVDAFLIVYDITNISSLSNAKIWLQWIKLRFPTKESLFFLIANKTDLNSIRVINPRSQFFFSQEINIDIYEVSAKDGCNVCKCFQKISDKILTEKGLKQEPTEHSEQVKRAPDSRRRPLRSNSFSLKPNKIDVKEKKKSPESKQDCRI